MVDINVNFGVGADTSWMGMGPAFVGLFDEPEVPRPAKPKPVQRPIQSVPLARAVPVMVPIADEVETHQPHKSRFMPATQIYSSEYLQHAPSRRKKTKKDLSSSWETIATMRRATASCASLSQPPSPLAEKAHVLPPQAPPQPVPAPQPQPAPLSAIRSLLNWLFP